MGGIRLARDIRHPILDIGARRRGTMAAVVAVLAGLLIGAVALSLAVGDVAIPLKEAATILASALIPGQPAHLAQVSKNHATILLDLRLPRVVLAILVGAALAGAGVVMQGFFQNPMADPYVLGVSSGAAMGAVIALALRETVGLTGLWTVPAFAFAGALAVTFSVYALSRRGGRVTPGTLLLTGIAMGSLIWAATAFLMLLFQRDLRLVFNFILGSLSGRSWEHVSVMLPVTAAGLAIVSIYSRDLNVMLLGDEEAHHLGLPVERIRVLLLAVAAGLAAAAVAVSGIVAFVGLIVPHLMRLVVGPDHRRLVPASVLGGAVLLVLADVAARMVLRPSEMPLGIITSLVGCPFFLYLLSRSNASRPQ